MLQRGEVTVANVMPFITILRQLGTVALRGREGRRAGEREGDRERSSLASQPYFSLPLPPFFSAYGKNTAGSRD